MSPHAWRPSPQCSHTEEHTADMWIVGEGEGCSETLSSMLSSLYLIIAEEYLLGRSMPQEFEVTGASSEEAFVRFLAEALYLLDGEGVVLVDPTTVVQPRDGSMKIRVSGKGHRFKIPEGVSGIEVKAITYHDPVFTMCPGGTCRARVLVDI